MTTFIYMPFFGQPTVYIGIYIDCRCLSSESCNLYQIFSVGSLSRADWKQQLDSAAASHQSPAGLSKGKPKLNAAGRWNWQERLTHAPSAVVFLAMFLLLHPSTAGGCFMHFICWRQAATSFWSTVVQWLRSDVSFVVAFATVERLWLFWLLFQQRPQTAWTYIDSIGLHKCGCNGD